MSIINNRIIDYDSYGRCIGCSHNMIVEKIADNKPIKMFLPDYTEVEFLLDDGSKMRTAFCKNCADKLRDTDHKKLMKKVFNGWKKEVDELDWTQEKKDEYLQRYQKRAIVTKTAGKRPEHLDALLKEFNKDKL